MAEGEGTKNTTKVDRLCFRMPENIDEAVAMADVFFPLGTWEPRARGGLGYEKSYQVKEGKELLCTVFAGGEAQRGTMYVDITGKGCARVDWDEKAYVNALGGLTSPKLRRMDAAVDFYHGEWSLEKFKADYEAGLFTSWIRPPKFQMFGDPYGIDGMTYYVGANIGQGKKKGEISCKFYEKGKEQKSEEFPNWNRCEVTMMPSSRQLILPPDLFIKNRDSLFAGAYPATALMLPHAEPLRLERIKTPKMQLMEALQHIKDQYGPTLAAALYHFEGDYLQVWDQICGKHPNPKYMPEAGARRRRTRSKESGRHKLGSSL